MSVANLCEIDHGRAMSPQSLRYSQVSHLTKVRIRPLSLISIDISYVPSIEREVTRKKYLASLESRTATEIAEEEALFTELKRLEQNERRFKKDRDELLRTILGIESGLPDIQAEDDSAHAVESVSTNKKTKKKGANEPETPTSASTSGPNTTISLGPAVPKKQSAKSAAHGMWFFEQ